MKYQLSAEEVRMRIKLKKTTNFVRMLESFPVLGSEDVSIQESSWHQ